MNFRNMRETSNALNIVFHCWAEVLYVVGIFKLHKDKFKDVTMSNPQIAFILRNLRDLKRKIISLLVFYTKKWLKESPLLYYFKIILGLRPMIIVNVFKLNKKNLSINHLNDNLNPAFKQEDNNQVPCYPEGRGGV